MYDKKIVRLNSVFMVLEGALFYATLSLIPTETVIARFMDTTTGSTTLAGLAASLSTLMFYVGEFICGLFIHKIAKQLPFQRASAFLSRSLLMLFAISLMWIGGKAAARLFIVVWAVIFILDGFVGLCWNSCMVRTLPLERRGKVFSLQQSVCGAIGILTGFVTQRVLLADISEMARYRILFTAAGAVFLLSACMMFFFRDVPHPSQPDAPVKNPIAYIKELLPLLVTERGVRNTTIARFLYTLALISLPVNYKFGQISGLSDYQLSFLVYMPVAGQIAGGFFWSHMTSKTSYPKIIFMTQLGGVICALFNFAALLAGAGGVSVMFPLCAAMFFIKFTYSANGMYNTYATAIVTEDKRANVIVLSSLISAPFTLGTTLAGALVNWAYWPVYFIMLACGLIGSLFTYKTLVKPDKSA